MGKPISIGQSHALVAALTANIDWASLSSEQVQNLIDNPREAGAAFTLLLKGGGLQQPALLAYLGSVELPAISRFVAKDKLTTESTPDGVQIFYCGESLRTNLLSKVKENVAACTLRSHRLTKDSFDKAILDELGDKATTTLAHIWELLKKQPNGESGTLLTNSHANIFYVQDAKGVLWAVGARWFAAYGGWSLYAGSVAGPLPWGAEYQVVSR